jgi:protein arginine N-methyltransferase 5
MTSPQQTIPGIELDSSSPVDDFTPTFYVGHHESKRPLPVTDFVLRQAQDVGVSTPPSSQRSY